MGEVDGMARLVFWALLAELVEDYVQKGDRPCVEGEFWYGTYERDGTGDPTTEIVVRGLNMLSGNARGSRQVPALTSPNGRLQRNPEATRHCRSGGRLRM